MPDHNLPAAAGSRQPCGDDDEDVTGYSREGDLVTLIMTAADYDKLVLYSAVALEHAGGARILVEDWMKRINRGNKVWQYE
jgi:hypothetical protein